MLLQEFPVFADFKKFAVFLFKKVEFVQIETADISDALNIFETINQRGVGLNPMDLLKNMIFMHIQKDQFSALNSEWKKLITNIEKAKEKPLRFLRYFLSAKFDISDPATKSVKGIIPEDKIYEWLVNNADQCGYKTSPFGFVAAMNKSIDEYIRYSNPDTMEPGNEYLRNIPRIAGSSYKLHLLLLLAAHNMNEETRGKFKQVLESVIYYAMVCTIKANETEKIFAAWCPEIRKVCDTISLKAFVQDKVIPQLNRWKENYRLRFMEMNYATMQAYRIRYILTRITKYVDDVRICGSQYADIDAYYDKKAQIEHIMPQTCTDIGAYGMSQEEYEYYVGKLGNLSLLERTINAICQNKPYAEKCEYYKSSVLYLTKSLPQLEVTGGQTAANKFNANLKAWPTWDKTSIDERQEMLYRLSEMIWNVDSYITSW